MAKQEEKKFSLSGSFQKAQEYIDTRLKIFQLKMTERSARLISSLMVDLVKTVFALFVVFFLSLALGFYLSELLDSFSLGFLVTGGIFVLLIVLVKLLEPQLARSLMNHSIKRIADKWYDDEEDESDEKGTENQ